MAHPISLFKKLFQLDNEQFVHVVFNLEERGRVLIEGLDFIRKLRYG